MFKQAEIILSDEQNKAWLKYKNGENIFITGPGGSGKSELIRKIYKDAIMNGKVCNVTAMTGCAAMLLKCKGRTLHSWASIGLGIGDMDDIATKIKRHKQKRENWTTTDILIVDEVSMMSSNIFELLCVIAKRVRVNREKRLF